MKKKIFVVLVIVFMSVLTAFPVAAQFTFEINSTGDAGDLIPLDGVCDTGGLPVGGNAECTLRAAIEESRLTPGVFAIRFSIPANDPGCNPITGVCSIQPGTPLPQIVQQVLIRGYSQTGAARATSMTPAALKIVLDGSQTTGNGLEIIGVGICLVEGLAIVNFSSGDGIQLLQGANGNTVRGNHIGTGVDGSTAQPNLRGVAVFSNDNLVGGNRPGRRNVISGNSDTGVYINIGSGNRVRGNFIGTTATGVGPLANSGDGVLIEGASGNRIGGRRSGAGNLISGNDGHGIEITGNDNVVRGNGIGIDVTGTITDPDGLPGTGDELGNSGDGVLIDGGDNNTIGGTGGTTPAGPCTGACNLISGNTGSGITIMGDQNVVRGNHIGTDKDGVNDLGNFQYGVDITGSSSLNNILGGTTPGAGNLISGNASSGVNLTGTANMTVLRGNLIGTDKSGTAALGNDINGVAITAAVSTTIGGTANGAGNTIAFNALWGVSILSPLSINNTILSNSIFSNGMLGIDLNLDGVTPNDADDPLTPAPDPDSDAGPNNLQNFPVLTSATSNGISIDVDGSLNSTPNTAFRIEFFANLVCDGDASGVSAGTHGEGRVFIGARQDLTDMNGDLIFSISQSTPIDLTGKFITATATDLGGNTSEFCECEEVVAGVPKQSVSGEEEPEVPVTYSLGQNYPNPFNPSTTISYSLKQANEVELKIYDMRGREVRTLVRGQKAAGAYAVVWDGRDDLGSEVASGLYVYKLVAGDFQSTRKMVFLK